MKKNYRFFLLALLFLLSTVQLQAQDRTVSGKVTDENTGEELIGVTVLVKGTNNGTVTDINGNFTINAATTEILIFSFVGFVDQEISASESTINVQMAEDVLNLEEVVISGLASSVKRSNLANAVSTVSSDKLTGTTSPQTLDKALYGKLTGANIVSNSGAPGGGISVKLRGISTLGGGSSEPLYIIDGVYIDNSAISNGSNTATRASTNGAISTSQDNASNRIADLNPEDIENIEILKGASASAIYGARANAGVIIITTKRGGNGRANVSFSQDFGFASILNPLGLRDYNEERVEASFGADGLAAFRTARDNGQLVDYEDVLYGNTGFISRSNLSVSGGNDKTTFFTSISYSDEEGIVQNTGFDRFSARLNLEHRVSEVFKFGVNANYIRSSAQRSVTNNDNSGVSIGISLVNTPPWANLFPDANGVFPNNPFAGSNFLQTVALSEVDEQTDRFIMGANLDINIYSNGDTYLLGKLQAGVDAFNTQTTLFFPDILQFQQAGPSATNGLFSRGDNSIFNNNLSAFLVFGTKAGRVDLTSSLGTTRLDFNQNRTTTQAQDLVSGTSNLSQANIVSVFDAVLESVDVGYVFQQEANFEDKLIFTAGVRADQSTLIGDEDKLFYYPKVSAAVNLNEFDFWNVSAIEKFKLRVAYGEAGGIPVANLVTLNQPQFTGFNGSNISGNTGSVISATLGDGDIRPERSREFEAGFDLSALDNRLSFNATIYNKTVDDLILTARLPTSSGFSAIITNAGELRNRGVELSLNAVPVSTENVNWEISTNWWTNDPEVTRLDVDEFTTGAFASFLGIFRIQEGASPTEIVGPTPTSDGADVPLGDATPDFQWSVYNRLTLFKNLEFSMLWHWSQGQENINLTNLLSDFGGTSPDFDGDNNGDGVVNGTERVNAFLDGNNAGAFVEDASFVKLREVALYYTLPINWVKKWGGNTVRKVRVGVSGNNLLLFSPYSGYDPEVSNFGNNGVSVGVDVAPFPSSRRGFFHIKIDL